jgi:hypothetical protein
VTSTRFAERPVNRKARPSIHGSLSHDCMPVSRHS